MNTEVATQELNTIQDSRTSSLALITNDGNMSRLMTLAKLMATSKVTVPKHLQNSEGDCMAIIIQATNWGMNPFAVAQKTHLVNGVLGYEAQLVNAVIGASGAIVGGFEYEYRGEGLAMECRVGAVIRGDTPHFDFIAAEVTKGIAALSLDAVFPIAYGILTTESTEQALERAGLKMGNKGWEAALTAIELVNLFLKFPENK